MATSGSCAPPTCCPCCSARPTAQLSSVTAPPACRAGRWLTAPNPSPFRKGPGQAQNGQRHQGRSRTTHPGKTRTVTVPEEDIDTLTGRMLGEKEMLTGEATGPSFGRQGDAGRLRCALEKSRRSPECFGWIGCAQTPIGHRALDVPSDAPVPRGPDGVIDLTRARSPLGRGGGCRHVAPAGAGHRLAGLPEMTGTCGLDQYHCGWSAARGWSPRPKPWRHTTGAVLLGWPASSRSDVGVYLRRDAADEPGRVGDAPCRAARPRPHRLTSCGHGQATQGANKGL